LHSSSKYIFTLEESGKLLIILNKVSLACLIFFVSTQLIELYSLIGVLEVKVEKALEELLRLSLLNLYRFVIKLWEKLIVDFVFIKANNSLNLLHKVSEEINYFLQVVNDFISNDYEINNDIVRLSLIIINLFSCIY
jgi:hypothetical protein